MNNLPKKTIIIIFLLALFGELVWATIYIKRSAEKKTSPGVQEEPGLASTSPTEEGKISIYGPTFSLNPSEGSFKAGETFPVTIWLDTKDKVLSGADAVLFYDAEKLVPEGDIILGTIFPDYPLRKINKEKAKISITGTMTDPKQEPFKGRGVFATIRFKALKEGEASLSFEFTPGATADSNLIEKISGKDMLEKVLNAKYTLIK